MSTGTERTNTADTKALTKAIKAASKKIRCLSTKALNSNLEHFCGDFAEAYRTGVEEAQGEILSRLRKLQVASSMLAVPPLESPSFSPNFDERNGIK